MNESELVQDLSLKSGVPEAGTRALLDALRDLVRTGALRDDVLWGKLPAYPDARDPFLVDALIASAQRHPLGLDFLLNGYLGSVAAEFRAHAFTVEAARERLVKGARGRG
jgi:hypothetical protein